VKIKNHILSFARRSSLSISKRNIFIVIGGLVLGVLFFVNQNSLAQSPLSDENGLSTEQLVTKTAAQSLMTWLAKIPAGQERNYGFADRQEFEQAAVGQPVRMATIDPQSILAEANPDYKLVKEMKVWRVPVLVKGDYRALLTVARVEGSYHTVEIGAAGLAGELGHFAQAGIGKQANDRTYILRIFQLRSDFILVAPAEAELEDGEIYPMQSARMYLALGTRLTIDYPRLVEILRQNFAKLDLESR
jgi:hypothetical protein